MFGPARHIPARGSARWLHHADRAMQIIPAAAAGLLTVMALVPAACPDVRPTSALPSPLHGEALAWDEARGRLALFGGREPGGWLAGTWEWDGRVWRQAIDARASPPARAGHTLAFDPDRKRVVLYGGMTSPPPSSLCDTWEYDGTTWREISTGPCSGQRSRNASLVFDTRRRHLLLLDGPAIGGDQMRAGRLWAWQHEQWRLIDANGPRRTGFSQAAFDDRRGVLVVPVLFGGPDAGVWEWNGTAWNHVGAHGPAVRQTYALAWDSRRQRVLLRGGQGGTHGPYLADQWTWSGTEWTESLPTRTVPAGRGGATLVDDRARARLLYFGGYNDQQLGDFWSLQDDVWTRLGSR
ncbi:hypothetical protein [Luteitalea pratensis]|nr:hypothetical protein [Luteitalea pratensis]